VSLLAFLIFLVAFLLALLGEILLWVAFRRRNHGLLHRISGLVLLAFGLLLPFVFYDLLVKPYHQASWPWSWVNAGLRWYLLIGSCAPFLWVGTDLVRNVPPRPAEPLALLDWKVWLVVLGWGCLAGVVMGCHWLDASMPLWFVSGQSQGSAPIVFGFFSLNGFLQGFLWVTGYLLPGTYCPWLSWSVQSFSERRWFVIGTILLLLSVTLLAWLIQGGPTTSTLGWGSGPAH
jgi:hypothetical protein